MKRTRNDLAAQGRDMLKTLISAFVDHREDVNIIMRVLEFSVAYTIRVHPEDQGKVIGKSGLHIKSIQHIMKQAGEGVGLTVITTLDSDEQRRRIDAPYRANPSYDPTQAAALLRALVEALVEGPTRVSAEKVDAAVHFQIAISSKHEFDKFNAPNADGISTKTALEALWKAYGNKEGATFYLVAVSLPAGAVRE